MFIRYLIFNVLAFLSFNFSVKKTAFLAVSERNQKFSELTASQFFLIRNSLQFMHASMLYKTKNLVKGVKKNCLLKRKGNFRNRILIII